MAELVKVEVSKRYLRFVPQGDDASEFDESNPEQQFDVFVTNNSKQFASFQLELLAAGLDIDSGLRWYRLEPQVGAKKPPGQITKFTVKIVKAPIPAYGTTIDLTLKVFSVESEQLSAEQKLKLEISRPPQPYKIYLPIKEFKATPGDAIEIPVLVYNLSPKYTNIRLMFVESGEAENITPSSDTPISFHPSWFDGVEQIVPVNAGGSAETSFRCQIPASIAAFSQPYPFRIEAQSDTSSYVTLKKGTLEILPWGVVEWSCPTPQQTIPSHQRRNKRAKKYVNAAIYELQFENRSNLPQHIQLQISPLEQKQCRLKISDPIALQPGESNEIKPITLTAHRQRPLLGLNRRLLFHVYPKLGSNSNVSDSIYPDPNVQAFELIVKPSVPLLLQLVIAFLLAIFLGLMLLLHSPSHRQPVNSVRLIENGNTVISGSGDRTIRRWQVSEMPLLKTVYLKGDRSPFTTEAGGAVRIVRQQPQRDGRIAAGLANGDLKLWNVAQKQAQPNPKTLQPNDRVFGLDFSEDSGYLYSGHSSGFVRQWQLEPNGETTRKNSAYVKFPVSAVAVSQSQSSPPNLVVIGERYNKLSFWDWQNHNLYELQYKYPEQLQPQPIVGQQDYIESLAIADQQNLLVTADTNGFITLWDLNKIRSCISDGKLVKIRDVLGDEPNVVYKLRCSTTELPATELIVNQWQSNDRRQAVRAVAFDQTGEYLASGGDDGRVMLWPPVSQLRSLSPERIKEEARNLDRWHLPNLRSSAKINSIDVQVVNNQIRVVTGDDQHHVSLFSVKKTNADN
ncbi:hypothetical protein H6F95_07725 [Cyanobacteria bacterium FACHB-471]|nr:hypothetical protein [Cyanobacteria bacterium FACHB-471]